jgi:hypothetical protein
VRVYNLSKMVAELTKERDEARAGGAVEQLAGPSAARSVGPPIQIPIVGMSQLTGKVDAPTSSDLVCTHTFFPLPPSLPPSLPAAAPREEKCVRRNEPVCDACRNKHSMPQGRHAPFQP